MLDNIRVLTHSSIRIELQDKIIYVDPFEIKGELHDADIILITHSHYDHFSIKDIAKIIKVSCGQIMTKIFMPYDENQDSFGSQVTNVEPGLSYKAKGISFETVPAYNVDKDFHPKENLWVGYLIDTPEGKIYIAGDTDFNDDIKDIKCHIALVPIGGTYTMTAKESAELVNQIKPNYAIPTHYGSVVGSENQAREFANSVNPEIEVLIKKEY